MNEKEIETETIDIKELKPCICGAEIAPVFYIVDIGQAIIDYESVQKYMGTAMILGEARGLTDIFAPSTSGAKKLPSKRVILCQECFMKKKFRLSFLWEDDDQA